LFSHYLLNKIYTFNPPTSSTQPNLLACDKFIHSTSLTFPTITHSSQSTAIATAAKPFRSLGTTKPQYAQQLLQSVLKDAFEV